MNNSATKHKTIQNNSAKNYGCKCVTDPTRQTNMLLFPLTSTGQLYVGHVPGTTREHTIQSDPQQSSCSGERVLCLSSVMLIKNIKIIPAPLTVSIVGAKSNTFNRMLVPVRPNNSLSKDYSLIIS